MTGSNRVLIAASLPMPIDGLAELNTHVERMYGTGAMIGTAPNGYIRIIEPADGLGPVARKRKRREEVGDGILRSIAFAADGIDMTIEEAQDIILRLGQAFGTWFDSGSAENYVTAQFVGHGDPDAEYHLTVQKTSKPTAHELRRRAEDRVAELEQQVADLEARIRDAGGDI